MSYTLDYELLRSIVDSIPLEDEMSATERREELYQGGGTLVERVTNVDPVCYVSRPNSEDKIIFCGELDVDKAYAQPIAPTRLDLKGQGFGRGGPSYMILIPSKAPVETKKVMILHELVEVELARQDVPRDIAHKTAQEVERRYVSENSLDE